MQQASIKKPTTKHLSFSTKCLHLFLREKVLLLFSNSDG